MIRVIMVEVYSIISVILVSVISLIGAMSLPFNEKNKSSTEGWLRFFIALAVGALLGDVFIHLLPESFSAIGQLTSVFLMIGFGVFFVLDKVLHWRHHHHRSQSNRIEPYGVMNLVGDGLHNFADGALIAASYLVSLPVGIATTIAVIIHEIPQELGDYAILISAGFTRKAALGFNFLSALTSILGAILVLIFNLQNELFIDYVIAFTAGGFLYISYLLIRKLGEDVELPTAVKQLIGIAAGAVIMWLVKFLD